jgi:fatty acid desaturase
VLGTVLATSYPIISSFLIGVGLQQAGWLGHDYGHGRGQGCFLLNKFFGGVLLGFSSGWWSHKHNTHHCFPNRLEVDVDIHNEPFIHLWFPKEGEDVWYRKYQHIYYPIAYSMLHFSWRMQSIIFLVGSGEWPERVLVFLGYCWYLSLPLSVTLGSLFIGGFLVAVVVTCNHQTEDILPTDSQYCFSTDQFLTTRGVHCDNFVTEYLFGGMQYQLEHHLFPTMPRYYFPKLRPVIKAFA